MEWLVYCKHEHVDHISSLKSQICGSALFAVQLCFQIQLQIQNKYKIIAIVKVRIEISVHFISSSNVRRSLAQINVARRQLFSIRDGISTATYTAYTVCTVYTADTAYII